MHGGVFLLEAGGGGRGGVIGRSLWAGEGWVHPGCCSGDMSTLNLLLAKLLYEKYTIGEYVIVATYRGLLGLWRGLVRERGACVSWGLGTVKSVSASPACVLGGQVIVHSTCVRERS